VNSFVAGLTRADYERDLRAAAAAHMNMIRVWGGGIYESEDFYDICDELGLLVWQDFMFACTLYPADDAFLESVRAEAAHQITRLRHRACLALWCGNNEVWACNADTLLAVTAAGKRARAEYEKLFHDALASVCAAHDPVTAYWPSSPWRGDEAHDFTAGENRGDTHFWAVWHGRAPVKDYERYAFRFVSEFGMQSYCSPETQATFCPPEDGNIFGLSMENHQKNRGGNQVILDYVSRRYRFPKSQEALIYLSQLNQAHCMQTGVEHYRRSMPRCMGALYWQLNDCWPVASWSSIEFTGRWRALHHVARRFFAPLLASAHVPGDETTGIGNYRGSTINEVDLYTVCDAPAETRGVLRWDVFHLDGRVLLTGSKKVALRPGESVKHKRVDLRAVLKKFDRDHIYLRIALDVPPSTGSRRAASTRSGRAASAGSGQPVRVSEETVFLTAPRFLELPKAAPKVAVRTIAGERCAEIDFTSRVFQHRFAFDLAGIAHHASDNFFELYPGETKTVRVELEKPATAAQLKKKLTWRSLADTW
jgi:beta-mannosidase